MSSEGGDGQISSGELESQMLANQKVNFGKLDFVSLLFMFGGVGQCMWIATEQKFCQIRRSVGEPQLMFPERKYYMNGMSNKNLDVIPWKMYKDVACNFYDDAQMKYGGPEGQMVSIVGALSVLGQIYPCPMMEVCRITLMQRCYYYDQIEFALECYLFAGSVAGFFYVCTAFLLIVARKKKYRVYTSILGAVGTVCFTIAMAWWEIITDETLGALESIAPFPFAPYDGCGEMLLVGGTCMMWLGCYCGCCGMLPERQPEDDEDEEDEMMMGEGGGMDF